jgi:hypothetical protein
MCPGCKLFEKFADKVPGFDSLRIMVLALLNEASERIDTIRWTITEHLAQFGLHDMWDEADKMMTDSFQDPVNGFISFLPLNENTFTRLEQYACMYHNWHVYDFLLTKARHLVPQFRTGALLVRARMVFQDAYIPQTWLQLPAGSSIPAVNMPRVRVSASGSLMNLMKSGPNTGSAPPGMVPATSASHASAIAQLGILASNVRPAASSAPTIRVALPAVPPFSSGQGPRGMKPPGGPVNPRPLSGSSIRAVAPSSTQSSKVVTATPLVGPSLFSGNEALLKSSAPAGAKAVCIPMSTSMTTGAALGTSGSGNDTGAVLHP